MKNYIFLTAEGYTFQPSSESPVPKIENLQVIGFSSGEDPDHAFKNLMNKNPHLRNTTFDEVFCYPLRDNYRQNRKSFSLHS